MSGVDPEISSQENESKFPLSVVLITRNAGRSLRACLRSVSWADDLIVVDAESTDDTVAIAESFGARVWIRPWKGYADQRRFALSHARYPWVFVIDADEIVTPELAETMQRRVGREEVAGYRILRLNHFLGKPIRHGGWFPDWVLRCVQKERAWVTEATVHEGLTVDGPVGILEGPLLHDSYPSIWAYFEKMNTYTTLEVDDKRRRLGRRVTLWDLLLHPIARFFRMYGIRRGFLDGRIGFLVACFSSLYLFVLYAKIWEKERHERKKGISTESSS